MYGEDAHRNVTDRLQPLYPVLFLNTTHVHPGQKGILTPLSFEVNPYFKNVIDVLQQIRRHIALKTAVSISARFPVFMPPAEVQMPRWPGRPVAHYVDGGYIDNTGLETSLSVLSTIFDGIQNEKIYMPAQYKITVHVVFIRNSAPPCPGFFQLLGQRRRPQAGPAVSQANECLLIYRTLGFEVDSTLYKLSLDRYSGRIPLGWQLSSEAARHLNFQRRRLLLAPGSDFNKLIAVLEKSHQSRALNTQPKP